MATVGKTTLRIDRTFNATQISVACTGRFGELNLSTYSNAFTVSPILSADTPAHYIKAILLAAAAQIV